MVNLNTNDVNVKKPRSIMQKKGIIGILFAVPALLIVVIFNVIPIIMSVRFSFTDWNGISSIINYVGFHNYFYVLKDEKMVRIFLNTLIFAIIYVPILNCISFVLAIIIFNIKKMGNVYKTIIFFSNLLSAVVVGFIWRLIFDANFGLFNKVLTSMGLQGMTQDWLGQNSTVIPSITITIIWFAAGYYLIIYVTGLCNIPLELYESCDIDGANWWQRLTHITIPMLMPVIKINIILTTIAILSAWDLPYVLTEGGPGYSSQTVTMQVYTYAFQNNKPGLGTALAVMFTIFVIAIMLTIQRVMGRKEEKLT